MQSAYTIFSNLRGDNMDKMKSLAWMAVGVGATLMYQKYNKSIMKKMDEVVCKTKEMAVDKLEEML